jgi:hypothetical protein
MPTRTKTTKSRIIAVKVSRDTHRALKLRAVASDMSLRALTESILAVAALQKRMPKPVAPKPKRATKPARKPVAKATASAEERTPEHAPVAHALEQNSRVEEIAAAAPMPRQRPPEADRAPARVWAT